MGYANPSQLSAGIHTRQYSRAFVIDDGINRVVFVSVDCALMDQVIKTQVRKHKPLWTKINRYRSWMVNIQNKLEKHKSIGQLSFP